MASLNKVFIIGNLTMDPELRFTPSGTPVANLRVAVNHRYPDSSGGWVEEASFFTVVAWGRQAEVCNEYLRKGRPVLVEGRLRSRSWETPEGQKRSMVEIVASRVQFLDRAGARADEDVLAEIADSDLQALGEGDVDEVPF
ncbi:MAG: single-stranded DNA-binding protein [Actinomycetota bacterium]|nr:single-stranded DNA-binding protein [Actinomycetota bacterium]